MKKNERLISYNIMINEIYKKCTSLKFWQKIFKVLKVLILLISFSSISIISLHYNILSMTQNSGRIPWGQGDTPSIQPIIRIMTVLHLLCFTFPYFHSSRDQIYFDNNNSEYTFLSTLFINELPNKSDLGIFYGTRKLNL